MRARSRPQMRQDSITLAFRSARPDAPTHRVFALAAQHYTLVTARGGEPAAVAPTCRRRSPAAGKLARTVERILQH